MKREITKDYTVDALRYYAASGKPSYEEIRTMRDKKESELKDLFSIEKIYSSSEKSIKDIIELVYFENPSGQLSAKEIKSRISATSVKIGVTEGEIRAVLKQARILFAKERGLRVG